MAINFPTSLDVFTDPTSSDQLNLPSHSGQHTDLNNAVEALEAKVGINSSAVTSSHDYKIAQLEAQGVATAFTPSWTNLTPGNATEAWYYTQVNDFVYVVGSTTFGSTTSVSGLIYMDYPVSTTSLDPGTIVGSCRLSDSSPTTLVMGAIQHSSASQVAFHALLANTTYVERGTTNATTPFTWASGDRIHGFFAYSIV